MQIFVSDYNPVIAAQNLDNKRVNKMILESAQMMSTAMHVHSAPDAPYRITHINHPCSIFTRKTRENYKWVLEHFLALCWEYQLRHNRTHKCLSYYNNFLKGVKAIPSGPLTSFPNCSKFKNERKITRAYKKHLLFKWRKDKYKPRWYTLTKPEWAEGESYVTSK